MAQEVQNALHLAKYMIERCKNRKLRLLHPMFSLAWFGVTPAPYIDVTEHHIYSTGTKPGSSEHIMMSDVDLSHPEQRQGFAEKQNAGAKIQYPFPSTARMFASVPTMDSDDDTLAETFSFRQLWRRWRIWRRNVWNHGRIIQVRWRLWKVHRSIRHSSHLRHAVKNAIGVALLSFPAFMPIGSGGTIVEHGFIFLVQIILTFLCTSQLADGSMTFMGNGSLSGTVCQVIFTESTR